MRGMGDCERKAHSGNLGLKLEIILIHMRQGGGARIGVK